MISSRSFDSSNSSLTIADIPDFDNMQEVSRITRHRNNRGIPEYLVEWKDGSPASWVNYSECYCPNLVFEYEKSKGYWNAEYEIESILDVFQNEVGQTEYLVKWKDRLVSTKENPNTWFDQYSWVNENDMASAQDLIEEFHRTGFQYIPGTGKRWIRKIFTVNRKYPIDCYLCGFDGTVGPKNRFYSIDDVYLMPNGRRALRLFNESLNGINDV
ncbi:uncharacterized protein LOC116345396 isoform X1 [Contarinia nasturtii]|uniref:uncharacterized protein LOC116345396 isoform X1 n=1 Tax=Contarinia nasturtii TaxID=265458 RepID=UPI0012D3E142|nr:uncharacterized protein LOC116345396 isoform X1 [Contarinia nasturtii]